MDNKRKDQYVTDKYVQEVEHYIYNDLPIPTTLIKDNYSHTFNEEVAKELMKKGEKYVQLKQFDHVVVTSFGRVINTSKVNQYRPKLKPTTSILLYIAGYAIDIKEVFLSEGWEFDLLKIYNRYKRYGWGYQTYGSRDF